MNENTNQMALVSVISAAIAWIIGFLGGCVVTFVFPPLGLCTGAVFFIGNIVAVVTGHMARNQIKQSGGEGNQMATVGLVLGWVGVGLLILSIICAICSLFSLALMGPQIGTILSDIAATLEPVGP